MRLEPKAVLLLELEELPVLNVMFASAPIPIILLATYPSPPLLFSILVVSLLALRVTPSAPFRSGVQYSEGLMI